MKVPGRPLAAIAAALLLAACAEPGFRPANPEAIQKIYQQGTPHTDARGTVRLEYSAADSFLPIGVYHALVGERFGRRYDLALFRDAGFNTIHVWEGQRLADIAPAARDAGLRLIFDQPTAAELAADNRDPASPVLAWIADQEPTGFTKAEDWPARLAAVRQRIKEIRDAGSPHPGIIIDTAQFLGERAERWAAFNSAAEITSHFNYPLSTRFPLVSLSTLGGVPQSVGKAVELAHERKPVWFVLQAFASPRQGWRLPEPGEFRAMAYTALIHGATGLVYFSYDSFVTRDDGVIGVAPAPIADFGPTPDYNGDGRPALVADDNLTAQSAALWQAATQLNAELTALRPWLLSPTSRRPYGVEIAGDTLSRTPIRTLLKERDGAAVLLVVNVDNREMRYRVKFDAPIAPPEPLFDAGARPIAAIDGWDDKLPPVSARVYRFRAPP